MKAQQLSRMRLPRRGRKLISLDITPAVPAGRQLIQSYGAGRFRVAGQIHIGSILLTHANTLPLPVNKATDITVDNLFPVINRANILIVGCGAQFSPPSESLRSILKNKGMSLEWMDTGAACRTFNVLLIEERDAAAALIAVD